MSISQKRRGLSDFCAEKKCNLRSCLVVHIFSMGSTLSVTYDLMLALRSQTCEYLPEIIYRHMPWSTWNGSFRIYVIIYYTYIYIYSYGNAWMLLTLLETRGWSGHIFAASASPTNRTSTKKLANPLPLFMAVSMTPNMWHSSRYCKRQLWLIQFGAFSLNQLVSNDPRTQHAQNSASDNNPTKSCTELLTVSTIDWQLCCTRYISYY